VLIKYDCNYPWYGNEYTDALIEDLEGMTDEDEQLCLAQAYTVVWQHYMPDPRLADAVEGYTGEPVWPDMHDALGKAIWTAVQTQVTLWTSWRPCTAHPASLCGSLKRCASGRAARARP
jgi:hypothetical protein